MSVIVGTNNEHNRYIVANIVPWNANINQVSWKKLCSNGIKLYKKDSVKAIFWYYEDDVFTIPNLVFWGKVIGFINVRETDLVKVSLKERNLYKWNSKPILELMYE